MKKNRRILNNIIQLIKILNFVKKYQLLIFIDLRIFYKTHTIINLIKDEYMKNN